MKPHSLTTKLGHPFGVLIVCLALILSIVPIAQAKADEPFDRWQRHIRPANSAPVIEGVTDVVEVIMSEDSSPLPFNLELSATDADGDPLTWFISTPPAYGAARISGNENKAVLAYKSFGDYAGQDSFSVTVADKQGHTDSVAVNISIQPVADAPNSQDGVVSIAENTTANFTAADFPFTDPDEGDSLQSIQITAEPAAGTLYLDANANDLPDENEPIVRDQIIPISQLATLKFAPALDDYGAPYATITFLVNDGALAADYESLLNINVTHTNLAPVNTMPGDQTVDPDTDLTGLIFTIADVDDSGANNFGISLTALHGTLTLPTLDGLLGSGNGTSVLEYNGTLANLNAALNGVTYRGLPGYVGPDTILLSSRDQDADNPLTITNGVIVMVASQNHAPVIDGDSTVTVVMSEDSAPTPFALTLSASDADADTLTWSLASSPANGQAVVRGTGLSQIIDYRAYGDYAGADSFVVKVQDGWGGVDTVTVNVSIEPVADAPQSADARVSTPVNTAVNLGAAFPYDDVDGDALHAVRFTALPANGTLYLDRNASGTVDDGEAVAADQSVLAAELPFLTFKPAPDESGTDYALIFFLVNDGLLDADYESQLIVDVVAERSPSPVDQKLPPQSQPAAEASQRALPPTD